MTSSFDFIENARKHLGDDLLIAAHHYQSDEVVQHADLRGDSLELARKVAQSRAKHIVFCGVYFMAESAALLAQPEQSVYLPEVEANCMMSLMTPHALLDKVLGRLIANGRKLIPLAYVNTSVGVKAVCGKHGGAVCTSANAPKMLEWAMKQGDGVLFLPDKNLAMNTARQLNIPAEQQLILDIRKGGEHLDLSTTAKASLLIWPGCCAIHARFNTKQIAEIRQKHPQAKVIVHPECPPEVVLAADAAGSTSFLIRYVEAAQSGEEIFIGTEWHLVNRLAKAHASRGVKVAPIIHSVCSHMEKITEAKLAATLEHVVSGSDPGEQRISVPQEWVEDARASLVRMLEVCA